MPHDVPGTTLPPEGRESVRYSENIKAYNVGRYIDPSNNLVMHEAHSVYRVETTGKWNLHPNGDSEIARGPLVAIVDPAHKEVPVTAEIAAEVAKQKNATQAVLKQGERLNETLSQVSAALDANRHANTENKELRGEFDLTKQRLDLLEKEIRGTTTTNSAPLGAIQTTETW